MKRIACMLLAIALLAGFAGCARKTRKKTESNGMSLAALLSPCPEEDRTLFPNGASIEAIEGFEANAIYGSGRYGRVQIVRAESVLDAKAEPLGYVIVLKSLDAYNPPLTLALGIRPDGTTAGIVFLELNETPGKGSLANEPTFRDQFTDRSVDDLLENRNPWNGNIEGLDAISGATVTSKAVLNAVSAGLDFYRTAIAP